MSALISKCESLLTTAKVLSSSLSEISAKLRTKVPQTKRPTRSSSHKPEQGPVNGLLLLNVLQDLESLQGQSETLQSQVEAIKTEFQSNVNQEQGLDDGLYEGPRSSQQSPTPCERLPNPGTSQPDGPALSSCRQVAQDLQPGAEKGVMVEPESAGDTSPGEPETQEDVSDSDSCRGRAKGHSSTICAVAFQRAVAPSISVTDQCPDLPTAPRSSTPASDSPSTRMSYTSHDMSPASVGTQITWPDSSARGCSQDTLMSNNEHGGRSRRHSAGEDTPMQTNFLDKNNPRHGTDITDRANPHERAASLSDNSRNTHPDPTRCGVSNDTTLDTPSPGNSDLNDAGKQDTQSPATARGRVIEGSRPIPQIVLSSTDMERLVPQLAELERQGAGQHISVPQIDITLADLQSSIGIEDADWQYTSIRYEAGQKDKGFARVYISHDESSIDWSAFTAEVKRPTIDEAKAIFEKAAQDPPTKSIPYYVGHANGFPHSALDPGPVITNNPVFKDLHTPYHHIGGDFSAHCCHCEDMTSVEQTSEGPLYHGLRSYSEVYFGTGYKLWLVIAKHHVAKFDEFVRSKWSCNECNQGVRHECLLFAPSLLDAEGINYIIAVVGRGEAFWTTPGQQHQIINFGHCAARSINFSHPEDQLDLAKSVQCPDCGMFEVGKVCGATIVPPPKSESRQGTKTKRKRQEPSAAPLKKVTRTGTASQRELEETRRMLKDIPYYPPDLDLESLTGADVEVYKLVASIQSTLAIQQFIQLVHQWRDEQSQVTFTVDSIGSPLDKAMALVTHFVGKTRLHKFCLRLAQIRLVQEIDKNKGPIRQRSDPKFLDDLASRNMMTRQEVKRHVRDGKQWSKLCGSHNGLLAFILLDSNNAFGVKKEEWVGLGREDRITSMKAFHNLLDNKYMRNILVAGKALEEMVSGSPIVFSWEKDHLDPAVVDIDVRIGQYTLLA